MSKKNKKTNYPQDDLRLTDQQAKDFSSQSKEIFEDDKGRFLFNGMIFKNKQELIAYLKIMGRFYNMIKPLQRLKSWLKKRFRLT